MEGPKLIDTVVEQTGLPSSLVKKELLGLLKESGLNEDTLSLDELRKVLATYLQDVLAEAKSHFSE